MSEYSLWLVESESSEFGNRGKSHESTIAIVGATSAVGRELVRLLELRDFPVKQLTLFASEKTAGQSILFKKQELLREIRIV